MDDHELMRINADTGFTYDDRGRMLSTNEPRPQERGPAPRLFLGSTMAGYVARLGAAVPDDLARRLQTTVDQLPPVADLRALHAALSAVREALAAHAAITAEVAGPAYRFPDSIAGPGEAVELTVANRALAQETYPWLYDELADWRPCFAVVRDGAAVSVCFSSRLTDQAAAAGVETFAAFRGRGYAGAVTAAWGAAIRESGRIPFYGTSWENQASQAVARRAGLIMFGVEASWV